MELEGLPEVEEVTSIATATRMDNDEGDLLIQDLQSDRDLDEIEIAGIRNYLNKYPNIKNVSSVKRRTILFNGTSHMMTLDWINFGINL
jgi:hypothetical protein